MYIYIVVLFKNLNPGFSLVLTNLHRSCYTHIFFPTTFCLNILVLIQFHNYQESHCLRKQNQVLDSSLVLISKIKPNFHSVLTNPNQNQGFLSPEPINTYRCWVVLTRTLDSQTSITFGDKRPGY